MAVPVGICVFSEVPNLLGGYEHRHHHVLSRSFTGWPFRNTLRTMKPGAGYAPRPNFVEVLDPEPFMNGAAMMELI